MCSWTAWAPWPTPAHAVESGDTDAGGEVSVGATTDQRLLPVSSRSAARWLRFLVERGNAGRALHRQAVDAAVDCELAVLVERFQGAKFSIEGGGLFRVLMRTSISTVASAAITLVRVPPRITPGLTETPRCRSFNFEMAMIWRASSRMALCPLPGSRPAWGSDAFHIHVYSPTPLRAVFTAPRVPAAGSRTRTAADSRARDSVILREKCCRLLRRRPERR